jgi:apolipoprotein N-acyltransferase
LSLAFYPGPFGFLAWFSLARPFLIIARLRGQAAFRSAWFFGLLFNAFCLYWVAGVTIPGTLAAIVIVSLYYAVTLVVFSRLHDVNPRLGWCLLPFLWVGMEYFRTQTQFAFPWSDMGYTQSYYLYLLQIVSVISVHGLSLLVVAVNVLLAQVLRREVEPPHRVAAFSISLAVVLALLAHGWVVTPKYPIGGDLKVALLQGSVPLDIKWERDNAAASLMLYDSLTQSVADSGVALYVWPETAAPCYLTHNQACRYQVGRIARRSGGYHLVGAMAARRVNDELRHFNSCFQVDPEGDIGPPYDKVKLVPFSEQVPYQDELPFLRRDFLTEYFTFIDQYGVQWWSDFYPGDSAMLFELPQAKYGVLICFESTFPEYARQMIRRGAGFLVGITNDTWFGRSVGIHMHSRIFITRVVENRSWGVRAANSGLSYIVDNYGRIRDELPIYSVATLKGKVGLLAGDSFFTRHGDLAGRWSFLILVSAIGILVLVWAARKTAFRKYF